MLDPEKQTSILGLMTGSSADGLDICLVRFSGRGSQISYKVVFSDEIPYPKDFKTAFSNPLRLSPGEVKHYDILLGKWLASILKTYKTYNFKYIASHGQTIKHEPPHFSLQIGAPSFMANEFNVPVIYDFRTPDVAAGGQGAPLIPVVDKLLFEHPSLDRLALNIGGISNLTIIPSAQSGRSIRAWDTGPGNTLIDRAVRAFTQGAEHFDRDGQLAARGELDHSLLSFLLEHKFYQFTPPKSAGQEQFGESYFKQIMSLYKPKTDRDYFNFICTLTQLTAITIADAIHTVEDHYDPQELFIAGGGTFNKTLIRQIRREIPKLKIEPVAQTGITASNKEAFGFAYLAYLRLLNIPGNIPSVTGAREEVLLGQICYPT